MSSPVAQVINYHSERPSGKYNWRALEVWCPGCRMAHRMNLTPTEDEQIPKRSDGTDEHFWTWNGDLEAPTVTPSILCFSSIHKCSGEHFPIVCPNPEECDQTAHLVLRAGEMTDRGETVAPRTLCHNSPHTLDQPFGNCHSYLVAGSWEFLPDSAHVLAGQRSPMVPLPAEWIIVDD